MLRIRQKFGIKKNGKLEYCIEISGGVLRQFKANYNKPAPLDIVTTVHKFLFDNKIIREAEVPSWY